ncbi:MAG: protein-L-isoaspartate(D-aspartate) O-methyltransferase [Candidatus Caldatribacteriaceae bacterium]
MRRAMIFFFLTLLVPFLEIYAQNSSLESARQRMITEQIIQRGIMEPLLLEAFQKVPREEFVPENLRKWAYEDTPLPIGYGQTISQPFVVALMTEKIVPQPGKRILEVGTGSGYQAAILGAIGCEVYTVEIVERLALSAEEKLRDLGYNVAVRWGDGYFGWKEKAPFDAIIVTCSADHVPPPLLEQLKEGGRMVIPVGPPWSIQSLWLVQKTPQGIVIEDLGEVRFVPLTREVREQ